MGKSDDGDWKAQIAELRKGLAETHSQLVHVSNRLHAAEAMLHSMLQLMDVPALETLAREYDEAIDRLATQLQPSLQRPHIWKDLELAVQERLQHLRALPAKGKSGES